MPIDMVCPRDYTLRTRMGHTIRFIAGEPTPVAEDAYQEALAKNIIPVRRPDDDSPAFGMAHAEITGTLRDAMVFLALDEIAKRNHSEEFTGGGIPRAAVVTTEVGIRLSATEVGKYWSLYRQSIAENTALPTHPSVEVVRELQACATRKQLTEFSEEHGIEMPRAEGKSVKELKELLLNAVINQHALAPEPDKSENGYTKPKTLMMD